jgi:peptidoglycan/LPS O-acetylase OafA/YrhL
MSPTMSGYLDLCRLAAAIAVFLVHANIFQIGGKLPFIWRLPSIGHDAVIAFFVLSGFVIAYVTDREHSRLRHYAVARVSRLWSVALPALLLTLVADAIGRSLSPARYGGASVFSTDLPVWRFAANLLFLNELWFSSVRPFSNLPFWSIGFEFWYYAIFGAWTYLTGRPRHIAVAALCLIAGPKILLLMPVWLMGVVAYRVSKKDRLKTTTSVLLIAASGLAYVLFHYLDLPLKLLALTRERLGPLAYDLSWSQTFIHAHIVGVLIALHFLGVASLTRNCRVRFPGVGYLASFTFALYLCHYPLLYLLGALVDHFQIERYRSAFVILGVCFVVAIVGSFTERLKNGVRRHLRFVVDRARMAPTPATPAG